MYTRISLNLICIRSLRIWKPFCSPLLLPLFGGSCERKWPLTQTRNNHPPGGGWWHINTNESFVTTVHVLRWGYKVPPEYLSNIHSLKTFLLQTQVDNSTIVKVYLTNTATVLNLFTLFFLKSQLWYLVDVNCKSLVFFCQGHFSIVILQRSALYNIYEIIPYFESNICINAWT